MTTQRKPSIQFAMMNDQDPGVVDDEDGDREINFLVDVSHGKARIWTKPWVGGDEWNTAGKSALLGAVFAGAPTGPLLECVRKHKGIGITDRIRDVLEFVIGGGK
jgi:hypothetical protein